MDEMRCKNCRWWQTTGPRHPVDDDYMEKYLPDHKRCTRANQDAHLTPTTFYVGFGGWIDDNTEARPILITGPEFGCVQWQPSGGDTDQG